MQTEKYFDYDDHVDVSRFIQVGLTNSHMRKGSEPGKHFSAERVWCGHRHLSGWPEDSKRQTAS